MVDAATLTLTDFLLARISEDEADARSAEERALTPWRATYGRQVEARHDGYLVTPEDEHSYSTDPPDEVALHIARWDPARVLAECEAKRRIVEIHQMTEIRREPDRGKVLGYWWDAYCRRCTMDGEYADITKEPREKPCDTLLALAAVYADHPDYRDEWRANG